LGRSARPEGIRIETAVGQWLRRASRQRTRSDTAARCSSAQSPAVSRARVQEERPGGWLGGTTGAEVVAANAAVIFLICKRLAVALALRW